LGLIKPWVRSQAAVYPSAAARSKQKDK